MDCRWALEILESARPDSADWQDSQLHEAALHVDGCPTCEETFRARQALDRRAGAVMRDIPVPDGLLERLTASFTSEATPESAVENATATLAADAPAADVANLQKSSHVDRRHWMRNLVVATAACAVVAGGWLLFRKPVPTLTVEDIRGSAPLQLESVDEFDGHFVAAFPLGWDSDALRLAQVARGYGLNKHGQHQMALLEFQFQGWDGATVTGVLAVVPSSEVVGSDELPTSFEAAIGSPGYEIRPWGGYTTASWVSGESVYVCFIPEEGDAQRRLEQILGSEPA
jgi:hypothetical protein